ncbi:heme o synthase [Shewanella amazonensis]|uniref:Protoheme IX farnesyltransferase n=1 Tax=Shewanella amazonensis (strain ATCC BAA-1098 / SB2B) TaxID=326297 RepID=CYOE_SHEAM|nr:heme o synthase [Shewanella amazonensis]A1SBD7.1 RecName: Full=Protoheme IX farnesyltransferase; AltName: Full=Heme B farnesyltransferase; AltName: Full=Heme O synthase [Shewanella amazonensis SB2B]ABM01694.1 protoheme IX farnesyltransferase [Shewanella amazonensis SB2B]
MAKSLSITPVSGLSRLPWRAYLEMTKPKVVTLMLLTVLVGMCLALPGAVPLQPLIAGMLGIAMMAGAAAAMNHLIDRRIDGLMARTYNRPLPKGKVPVSHAATFAALLALLGFACLYWLVNPLTAWLTLASLLGYAVVYTAYLKRATPQNIVIGGLAGAMPPLLGWTAVTNDFHGHGLLLVIIIFAWTPPHFWALAIHRKADYAKVDIPMLPVTHGVAFTKTCIFLYTILLALACLLPVLVGMSGALYLLGSTLLSIGFIYKAWQLKYHETPGMAMDVFRFSIYHLMLLFILLLVDHYI